MYGPVLGNRSDTWPEAPKSLSFTSQESILTQVEVYLMFKLDFPDICFFAGTALTIVLVVLDKAGKLKGPILLVLLAVSAAMMLPIAIGNGWVLNAGTGMLKFSRVLLIISTVCAGYSVLAIWISTGDALLEGTAASGSSENHQSEITASAVISSKPSLVFVFGAPLGDNDSAQWIMMLKHFGPGLTQNCDIVFYDDDRKNIEHEWLVKNPNVPYPPQEVAGESQNRTYILEAGPEGSYGGFYWNPVNPNSQHYTVSINCRDGVFTEKWQIARINGILRSAITIEHGPEWMRKNPNMDPVVFRYQDPEFTPTALATEMPKIRQGKVVHPGWKPSHRFEVPAAIIDPNGNIQTVSGVKLPDGSTLTDFGSWNILSKHYGN
jgi:hypothetical protein